MTETCPGGFEVAAGGYVATYLPFGLLGGKGAIRPSEEFSTFDAAAELVATALDCLETVPPGERGLSSCTDGRVPHELANGERPVPVRAQLAGASTVTGHYIFEALNLIPSGYAGASRVGWSAKTLSELGRAPSAHPDCGAGLNFNAVCRSIGDLGGDEVFRERIRRLSIPGLFDDATYDGLIASQGDWAKTDDRLVPAHPGGSRFLAEVEDRGNLRAITRMTVDQRGISGHVEAGILHVRAEDIALNERCLALLTGGAEESEGVVRGGGELFVISDWEIWNLAVAIAAKFGDQYLRPAMMAGLIWSSGCHRFLVQGEVPTCIVAAEGQAQVAYDDIVERLNRHKQVTASAIGAAALRPNA